MGIKHLFVSAVLDDADTSLVRPSNWNEDHVIDGDVDLNNNDLVDVKSANFTQLAVAAGPVLTGLPALIMGSPTGGIADINAAAMVQLRDNPADPPMFIFAGSDNTVNRTLFFGSAFQWGNPGDYSAPDWIQFEVSEDYATLTGGGENCLDMSWTQWRAGTSGTILYLFTCAAGNLGFLPVPNNTMALGNTAAVLGQELRWSSLYLGDNGLVEMGTAASRAVINHTSASDSLNLSADPDNATANSLINLLVDGSIRASLSSSALTFSNGATAQIPSSTFASLPAGVLGKQYVITDSTVNTWGATVAGGGAFTVLAWYNGTNWTVIGV